MKLNNAVLCPECDEVYDVDFWHDPAENTNCPFCGNSQYLRLDTIIKGKDKELKIPAVSTPELFLSLIDNDLTTISGKQVNTVSFRINEVDKTFKINRRYFRYNFGLLIVEESGPIGDEPCIDKEWYPCEEVKDEKA